MRSDYNINDTVANQPQITEWDYTKNKVLGLNPNELMKGSNKDAWWICDRGHSYRMRIKSRISYNYTCPMCAGRQAIVGETDLFSTNPELKVDWDYDKNIEFDPDTLMANSKKKVWWHCANGHSWEASIQSRAIHSTGCPQCNVTNMGKERVPLSVTHPHLLAEWDYKKNTALGLSPTSITYGSPKKAWWHCSKGHEWQALISNRARQHRQCPYCTKQLPIVGENDLATTHPELVKEWDFEKNADVKMTELFAGSHKEVWWKCLTCGHSYLARVDYRTLSSVGQYCPLCNNRILVEGENDLVSQCPELLQDWDYEKNNALGLDPSHVYLGDRTRAWWKCHKCGTEWQTEIRGRGYIGASCPQCCAGLPYSFAERAIYYYVHQCFEDALNNYKLEGGRELDVYIPSVQVAIEYDGEAWHGAYQQDRKPVDEWKNAYCQQQGIKLIRVRELNCYTLETPCVIYETVCHNKESLNQVIIKLLKEQFNVTNINVDVVRDEAAIKALSVICKTERSLGHTYPELAKQWHPTKNKELSVDGVSPLSTIKAWWHCPVCKNDYQAEIRNKTLNNQPCPFCKKMFGKPTKCGTYKPHANSRMRRIPLPPQTRSLPK